MKWFGSPMCALSTSGISQASLVLQNLLVHSPLLHIVGCYSSKVTVLFSTVHSAAFLVSLVPGVIWTLSFCKEGVT